MLRHGVVELFRARGEEKRRLLRIVLRRRRELRIEPVQARLCARREDVGLGQRIPHGTVVRKPTTLRTWWRRPAPVRGTFVVQLIVIGLVQAFVEVLLE